MCCDSGHWFGWRTRDQRPRPGCRVRGGACRAYLSRSAGSRARSRQAASCVAGGESRSWSRFEASAREGAGGVPCWHAEADRPPSVAACVQFLPRIMMQCVNEIHPRAEIAADSSGWRFRSDWREGERSLVSRTYAALYASSRSSTTCITGNGSASCRDPA